MERNEASEVAALVRDAALTEISGKTITYTQVTDGEFVATAVQAGMPEHVAQHVLGFYNEIGDNQLDEASTDLETLLGHQPATLTEGLRELFDL